MATKVTKEAVKYVVYAPFDFQGKYDFKMKHYEAGDEFVPSENMTRDENFDTFRAVEKRKKVDGENLGLSFTEIGDIISTDPKERQNPQAERYVFRHVLPVKEA